MNSNKNNFKPPSVTQVIYRFLGGAALGTFLVLVFISYGSSIDLNLIQLSIALLLVIACGLLSSIWGEKFINIVTRGLNGTSL